MGECERESKDYENTKWKGPSLSNKSVYDRLNLQTFIQQNVHMDFERESFFFINKQKQNYKPNKTEQNISQYTMKMMMMMKIERKATINSNICIRCKWILVFMS